MPYYDYKCADCRLVFETEHGMNDEVRPACPSCHSQDARRVYFPVGFKITSGLSSPAKAKISDGGSKSCGSCSSGVCSTCHSKG